MRFGATNCTLTCGSSALTIEKNKALYVLELHRPKSLRKTTEFSKLKWWLFVAFGRSSAIRSPELRDSPPFASGMERVKKMSFDFLHVSEWWQNFHVILRGGIRWLLDPKKLSKLLFVQAAIDFIRKLFLNLTADLHWVGFMSGSGINLLPSNVCVILEGSQKVLTCMVGIFYICDPLAQNQAKVALLIIA
jgi:hypothetical protein